LIVERHRGETRRRRRPIELGDLVAFFHDRSFGDDPIDLGLIDLRGLRVGTLDLYELACAKLAGRGDGDLEVPFLHFGDERGFRGARSGWPLVPSNGAADDENENE
jgi:hypothetical protein